MAQLPRLFPGCCREIKGFVTHICVTRIIRAVFMIHIQCMCNTSPRWVNQAYFVLLLLSYCFCYENFVKIKFATDLQYWIFLPFRISMTCTLGSHQYGRRSSPTTPSSTCIILAPIALTSGRVAQEWEKKVRSDWWLRTSLWYIFHSLEGVTWALIQYKDAVLPV